MGFDVAHLSTFPHGGAGMAATSIHQGLLQAGVTSRFYYLDNQSARALDASFMPLQRLMAQQGASEVPWYLPWEAHTRKRRQRQRAREVCRHYELHLRDNDRQTEVFSQPELVHETPVARAGFPHQLLHLHWTAFALDWPSFFRSLPRRLPIVWTLHDQNPYTGGCHFTTGCERFRTGCGQCPQLLAPGPHDLSRHAFAVKQALLTGRELHVVAPSRWMLTEAQKSPIFRGAKSFTQIPYGLDVAALEPEPGRAAFRGQRLLPTILFGAEDLKNARKGVQYALEGINHLVRLVSQSDSVQTPAGQVEPGHDLSSGDRSTTDRSRPGGAGPGRGDSGVSGRGPAGKRLRLWTFGKALPDDLLERLDPAIEVKQWGFVSDRRLQGQLYRAADVFWLPSLEDNQPQTALEAMGCGTPVVGFDVGGVPEIVRHQQTGLIVPARDSAGLARATWALLRDRRLRLRLSAAGRQMVRQEYSPERQSRGYLDLYDRILGGVPERQSSPAPLQPAADR